MNIGRLFMTALIALPFVEFYFLIKFAVVLGFLTTVALVLMSAMAGLSLMQRQGASTLLRVQQGLARGELPAREVINTGVVTLAGVLLIIPGFISDVLALILLLPPCRNRFTDFVLNRNWNVPGSSASTGGHATLEGEFHREE